MTGRMRKLAEYLRTSLWFIPVLMTLFAAALAWVTVQVDERYDGTLAGLLYSGGPDGSRVVLASIATSMVTVAGTVFSITIVVLTLASSQFGPRMLATFMRDRGNQLTLGTFVSTFLYALLVLRTITSDPTKVPNVAVSVAMLLAFVALFVLVGFIHHIATSIQAQNIVAKIGADLTGRIDTLFPDIDDHAHVHAGREHPELADHGAAVVTGRGTGYVAFVDLGRLVKVASENDLVLRLETRPGRFLLGSTPVLRVWPDSGGPAGQLGDEVRDDLAGAVIAGARRKNTHDVEFPLRQLAEVAVRALGPANNDPFTAGAAVNHIGVALCRAASRPLPPQVLADDDGAVRLVLADPITVERLVGVAYDQIRQAATFHASVYIHIIDALVDVVRCVRHDGWFEPLLRQGRLVLERAEQAVAQEEDRAVVRERYAALVAGVQQRQEAAGDH